MKTMFIFGLSVLAFKIFLIYYWRSVVRG